MDALARMAMDFKAGTFDDCIQNFTSEGVFVGKWSTGGAPNGVAVDSDGNVYVVDKTGDGRVVKIPPSRP